MIALSDGKVFIRPVNAGDIPAIYEAVRESIKEVSPWMQWCHSDYSEAETTAYVLARERSWENDSDYGFGVFEVLTERYLGGVGLNFINRVHQCANLGYWVRTLSTRRGVASSAARLAARFGLEELGLQRIEILVAVGNLPSQRAAEKTGALREGVLRKRLLIAGQPHDAVLYSLIAEDLSA